MLKKLWRILRLCDLGWHIWTIWDYCLIDGKPSDQEARVCFMCEEYEYR